MVVLMTVLYTLLAYYFVFVFAARMSGFEFAPQQQYLDEFAAQHSIMIRGINTNIGAEQANLLIKKVFEERFGPKKVIAVQCIKKTDNI